MTETELRNEIKKSSLSGVYFLYGSEEYMKKHYADEIRKTVLGDDSTTSFNYFPFDDDNAAIGAILDAVNAPAMMADVKLVDVTLTGTDLFRDKANTAALLDAVSSSHDTVLVIQMNNVDLGTEKKPSALLKQMIGGKAKCVNFEYQTESKLTKWLERHAAEYNLTISPDDALLMIRRVGRSMFRLQGEIEKAAMYASAHGLPAVSHAVIDEVVTKTDDEDAFRLANCILKGDKQGALACLDEKIRRRDDPIMVLSQITRAFCDLAAASRFAADGRDKADFARTMSIHPYRAELYYKAVAGVPPTVLDDAVARCTDADRLLKSTNLGYIAIERLVCTAK